MRTRPPYLRQDLTVSVDIDVASKQKTLVLPAQDVHDELSSAPWVLSVRDGRAYKTPVMLGLHGLNEVEIVDGLAEGAWALPIGSGVVTGQRVRPFTP